MAHRHQHGTINNVLTGGTHYLLASTGTWEVVGAGGHTITDSREEIKFVDHGSLKVTAGSTTPVTLTHERVPMADQYDWDSRGFFWVYSNSPLTATIGITVYNSTTESASASLAVRARRWTLVSVDGATPESFARAQITIGLSGLEAGETAYLTNPTILTPNAISRNVFAAESWMRLPQYLRDTDETQTDPDYPLLRFIDVLTADADGVFTEWRDIRYIPPDDEGGPTVSDLEPSVASLPALRWLAQLLGVRFYDPSTGTTSWINLEVGLDQDGNGPEWEEWESVPDTGDVGTDVSWEEIEAFAPGVSGFEELIRWQVETAYFGLRGGTKESVLETVKKVLTGTKYAVTVDDTAWVIHVQTKQSETPDNTVIGAASPTIEEIVANTIPAGFEFLHETVAG
jgi:hypothetical protein